MPGTWSIVPPSDALITQVQPGVGRPDADLATTLSSGPIRRMFERTLLTATRLMPDTVEGRMTREELALCLRIIRGETTIGVTDAEASDERAQP